MGWIVRVDVPAIDAELASSLLWDLGTTGIATTLGGVDPDPDRAGRPCRTELIAGFENEHEAATAVAALMTGWSHRRPDDDRPWLTTIQQTDDSDWVDPSHLVEVVVADVALSLEIGAAFGDGGHPTTRLAIDLMVGLARRPGGLGSVLDFGCGSGILSLAAVAGGASEVMAVDDDPAALGVTERNLERNHNGIDAGRIAINHRLERWPGRFNLILANVLLPVHKRWGPTLLGLRAEGAAIIVSGVLSEQRHDATAAYPGLGVEQEHRSGDWLGLVLA